MLVSPLILSIIPLLPPIYILYQILSNDFNRIARTTDSDSSSSSAGAQLVLFLALGILGHVGTYKLIPNIKYYMLKRGICGKDLGKKGTKSEDDDM